ncbi:MBL fold metallo-hydrolase [Patescibacteria group bacterium]|nr:MBL fold metallo-hydrolase [Patescibacteria group bacterium]
MLTGSEITKALNYDLPIDPTTNKQLDPQSIDTVIATHTHADHIGRIPMLVGR